MAEQVNAGRLVSAVIPARNAAATIRRAIDSVLAQTYRRLEIVVVDDCSTDATRAIIESYGAQRVRLVSLQEPGGAAGARNAGVDAAQGEIIAFLDADDEWLPGKISKQVDLIAADERVSFVACAANLISATGGDLGDIYLGQKPLTGPEGWKGLLENNLVATPTVLTWRRHLQALGGFDRSLKVGEDQDMWIRLALLGPVAYVPESLVRVHQGPSRLSRGSADDPLLYTLPMIERHIERLRGRLTGAEIRRIMAARLLCLGQSAYARGARRDGVRLIRRSLAEGISPLQGLACLVKESRPARVLKRLLRPGSRR